jgi:UDP:flavonoid glycosyltransferase YjiC (YdhE family)
MAAMRTSSGLILNTFDALEATDLAASRRDFAAPVFDIGPLHKVSPASAASSSLLRQDHGCLEWLNSQAQAFVLYVSFGSLASVGSADFVETAWGIALSGQPFLWVLRPDLVRGAMPAALPDGFDVATVGRGMVVSWAPQEEVLAYAAVGGSWTHSEWNSALEGMCAGVPMICRPCFGDQMGNTRHLEHVWQAGLTLEGELERGKVEATIRRLMQSEDGEEMRRRARELRNRAAESMAPDGSTYVNVDKLVSHILCL